MMEDKIRVLVADDHVLFRKGLVNLLSTQDDMEVVGEADEGLAALERTRELMPDIILMDIAMPGCDGLEATRRIKAEMPYVKIVMLTVSEAEEDLFQALTAGAEGYLLKNLQPGELFSFLRGVQKGEVPISPRMATKILAEFARQEPREPAPEDALSPREREILEHVVRGATNRQIAAALVLSENTVKNHLRNVIKKLHLRNRVQVVAYALRRGLVGTPHGHKPGSAS